MGDLVSCAVSKITVSLFAYTTLASLVIAHYKSRFNLSDSEIDAYFENLPIIRSLLWWSAYPISKNIGSKLFGKWFTILIMSVLLLADFMLTLSFFFLIDDWIASPTMRIFSRGIFLITQIGTVLYLIHTVRRFIDNYASVQSD